MSANILLPWAHFYNKWNSEVRPFCSLPNFKDNKNKIESKRQSGVTYDSKMKKLQYMLSY